MSKLSVKIAKKIQNLMNGETLPYGQVKGQLIDQMIAEGILSIKLQGRSRKAIYATNAETIINFLSSQLGINDLAAFIENEEHGTSRAQNIVASSNSKTTLIRTFKGFLVNCYAPIKASIKGKDFIIEPTEGTYTYIHDFDTFAIPPTILIVGIENPENFRFIHQQKQLFETQQVLFVSRYPQSKDLVTWLQNIPNQYLHFGDFDFEGIRIFRDEYYQHLKEKATFYIPQNIEELITKYGNKKLYDSQYRSDSSLNLNDELAALVSLFHQYKKCLEQEVLIEVK